MTSATFSPQVIQRASWPVRLGLGLTALTVLVAQIALTRVMSATTGYHFAFLILSVVMLGMAASAIVAFQGMRRRKNPLTAAASAGAAYRSSIFNSCAVAVLVISPPRDFGTVIEHVQLLLAVILFSLGFFHSGFVVVVVLTQYARDVARLYWLDLAGASLGCLLAIPLLNRFSALNVMMLCAAGMAIAGTSLAFAHGGSRARRGGLLLSLAALSVWGASALQPGLLRLSFAKGQDQAQLRWEQWNALARVTVTPEIAGVREAVEMLQSRENRVYTPEQVEQFRRSWQAGWGISPEFKGESLPSLWLELDADAGTPILGGGIAALAEKGRLDFLSWDVTAAAYVWRDMLGAPAENAFIVGGGGGRDVLTALAFDVAEVDVVELNPAVVEAVEQAFGDFSGRLYSHPRVRLSVGEARNELARRRTHYDLIQMSMIDTWAASMAGSLVMTENGLYTQEAFDLYLARLKQDGVLSVSRWYDPDRHGEAARVGVLMASTLRRAGVERPEDHIAILTCTGFLNSAVATLLLKPSPFTERELAVLQQLGRERGYRLLWPQLDKVSTAPFDLAGMLRLDAGTLAGSRFDLSPPTDDRPFFFNIDRPLRSWLDAMRSGNFSQGSRATLALGAALLLLLYCCYFFVIRPLQSIRAPGRTAGAWRSSLPLLLYFGGIGLGFMLIELALIQRYILFLGHPSYAIPVVLFTLLLFGGCGSFLTERIGDAYSARSARLASAGIISGALITALAIPAWLAQFADWRWESRLAIAVAFIAPLASLMGMLFPLGIRRLARMRREEMLPWMWGVNGIGGVIASVLGMLAAMNLSYTAVLLAGAAAYGVALFSLFTPEQP